MEFVKRLCKINDKEILKKLKGIPFFEEDNDSVRINNVLVIVYIVHKARVAGSSITLFQSTRYRVFLNNIGNNVAMVYSFS